MADNYQYIDSTGVIVPDTSDILVEVQNEYKDAFGADLVVTPDTPQGVLITSETLARSNVLQNNAAVANQINPNISGGTFLDAVMALTGIERTPATQTLIVGAVLTGVANTVIPASTQARTAAGDIFYSLANAILGVDGTAVVNFAAVEYGPVPCGVNALEFIVTNILGWETVTNPVAGVVGQSTQSDIGARALRSNTLAFQGVSLAESITSALYNTAGVQSLSFRENYNSVPMGIIVGITDGDTLADTVWALETTGLIEVDTTNLTFTQNGQTVPAGGINPWPTAAYGTTANITLSGLGTAAGRDWSAPIIAGDIVIALAQTTASQNGLWVAAAGAWTRHAYMPAAAELLGSNDGISMIKNSVYACVNGGSDVDVAAALLENKSSGAGWNGGEDIDVIEPASGQTYTVLFDRPAEITILVRVTTTNGDSASIKTAILNYIAGGLSEESGYVVGGDVSPWEIAGAINRQYPSIYLTKVEISYVSPSYTTNVLPIALNEIPVTIESNITVVVV